MVRRFLSRPLFMAVAGLLLALIAPDYPWLLVLAVPCLLLAPDMRRRAWFALFFAVGFLRPVPHLTTNFQGYFSGQATVASQPVFRGRNVRFLASSGPMRFLVAGSASGEIFQGDRLQLSGEFNQLPPKETTVGYPPIESILIADVPLGSPNKGQGLSSAMRPAAESFIQTWTSGEDSHDAEAFLLADSSALDSAEKDRIQKAGLFFLISISGIHLFTIVFLISAISRLEIVPRVALIALILASMAAVGAINGFRFAALRVLIVAGAALLSFKFRRRFDLLSAVFLAVLVELIARPETVYSPGLQLSSIAVIAAYACSDAAPSRKWRIPHAAAGAFIGSAPVALFWFHSINLLAPIASVYFVATLPVELLLVGAGATLSALGAPVPAEIFGRGFSLLAGGGRVVVDLMASFRFGLVEVGPFSGYWVGISLLIGFLLVKPARKNAE